MEMNWVGRVGLVGWVGFMGWGWAKWGIVGQSWVLWDGVGWEWVRWGSVSWFVKIELVFVTIWLSSLAVMCASNMGCMQGCSICCLCKTDRDHTHSSSSLKYNWHFPQFIPSEYYVWVFRPASLHEPSAGWTFAQHSSGERSWSLLSPLNGSHELVHMCVGLNCLFTEPTLTSAKEAQSEGLISPRVQMSMRPKATGNHHTPRGKNVMKTTLNQTMTVILKTVVTLNSNVP